MTSESDELTMSHGTCHDQCGSLQGTSKDIFGDDAKNVNKIVLKEYQNVAGNKDIDNPNNDLKDNSIIQTNEGSNNDSIVHSETKGAPGLPEVNVISENSLTERDIEQMFGSPYHKIQKNIFVEGNMISYVAPNFNDLIKKDRVDSPGSSQTQNTSRSLSSESLSSTNSGWSSDVKKPIRQMLISEDMPTIDPNFLADLEKQTEQLSTHLNATFHNFISHTNKMSFYALKSLDVYKESVERTCDTVDNSIKSMYALMAKCEELHHCMKPVYQIHSQIKEIKRVLDIFEMQLLSEDMK